MPTLTDRIISSALWAAYGDALGFIAEGVDARGLKRRMRGNEVGAIAWRRRVGWQGPDVDFPPGTYSDDTQLRLATARSIREDGTFDVEPFSRAELPIWPLYSLGAGRGSLDAARRLATGKQRWNELVQGDRTGRYINGGGNGAAMRVQPIAWVARTREDLVRDVIINTAVTHGHPKAFVGALFHAEILRETLKQGAIPDRETAQTIVLSLRETLSDVRRYLGDSWQTSWSAATAQEFPKAWNEAWAEVEGILGDIQGSQKKPASAYKAILEAQNLFSDEERGSATKTAAAAYAALLLYGKTETNRIVQDIGTVVGSDTDSIATMAGAILGAARADEMPHIVQDQEYLVRNATHLSTIASGDKPENGFHYLERDFRIAPARIVWDPNGARLGGIGRAVAFSPAIQKRPDGEAYQWHRLTFGQTILLRIPADRARHSEIAGMDLFSHDLEERRIEQVTFYHHSDDRGAKIAQPVEDAPSPRTAPAASGSEPNPEDIAKRIASRGFDNARIGKAIMNAARRPYGEGLAAAIAYAVARLARAEEAQRDRLPATPEPKPEPQPAAPAAKPEIQLQLRAVAGEKGTILEGSISNYGRSDAYDLRIQIGLREEPVLSYSVLAVKERHNISFPAPLPVVRNMPISVVFRNGDGRYRQDGIFEPASGVPDALLLKGLGDVKPSR